MTRAQRLDPIDGWHHVMNRGVDRLSIFFSEDDRLDFGRLLGEMSQRFGVEIHAYCLMGNHFHLLVRCPTGGLSVAMHYLLSVFARRVNERTDRTGHLFGDRFCSRLILDVQYLANVVRYIHLNPLDIAGIRDPADYRWSSHRTYLGLRPAPDWLTLDPVAGWFDGEDAFHRFVTSPISTAWPSAISVSDPKDLMGAVDMVLAERSDALFRHVPAQRRAVALSVASSLTTDMREQVHTELGIQSGGALRTAQSRAHRLMEEEPIVSDAVRRTTGLLLRTTIPLRRPAPALQH